MKAIDLFAANLGKRVQSGANVLTIALMDGKTGTLKSGEKDVPYVRLSNESEVIELHPEKAKQLFNKGEFGALRIMADITGTTIEDYSAQSETDTTGTPAFADTTAAPATTPVESTEKPTEASAGDAAPVVEKKESKKEATLRIFNELNKDGKQRKEIIARMRTELGLSIPGANTYYQNCKSGMWK